MPSACEEIQQICRELTPPHLLSLFDSWSSPRSDIEEHRKEAAHRVAVVRHWVDQNVPALLKRLHEILNDDTLPILSLEARSSIVVASSLYISARRERCGMMASSLAGREPWITAENTELARSVLETFGAQEETRADFALVHYILLHYLKPLFRSSTPSSINTNTGRAAPVISNLSGSATAYSSSNLMDDEVMWKGGDVERSRDVSVLGEKVLITVACKEPVLQLRHRALGCYNVLFYCCQLLQDLKVADSSIWEKAWPLVVPPLLTLLEDTAPLYRLIGSRILTLTLLSKGDPISSNGTLLLRTGVEPLLRQRLESNLTYINTTLSAALLQSSSEALLHLTQATTSDLRLGYSTPPNAIQDGGKLRYDQLSKLVDEGVLRVWAYATASITDLEDQVAHRSGPEVEVKETNPCKVEASDTINASIEILIRMTRKDALGIGIVRYLDVMLEFLNARLLGLETRLSRHDSEEQKKLLLDREICCAKAIEALLSTCQRAPGVRSWFAKCLTTVARMWVLLQHQQDRKQVKELQSHLQSIIRALSLAEPLLLKDLSQKFRSIDKGAFSALLDV